MPNDAIDIIKRATALLFSNGQTTHRVTQDISRLGDALGVQAQVLPQWDEVLLSYRFKHDAAAQWQTQIVPLHPSGVDMNKVVQTNRFIDSVCQRSCEVNHAQISSLGTQLERIAQLPPSSHLRFTVMCGLGASALGLIFGVSDVYSLMLIFLSASLGAIARRLIAAHSTNLFLQPLAAAAIAGAVGLFARQLMQGINLQLIELAPCMILVPGAHILNAMLDLLRGRLTLGLTRLLYALLILLAICVGLLSVLSWGPQLIDLYVPIAQTPLVWDVIAAGLAVAAFGAFFSMPWRILIWPVIVGMTVHACRWGFLEFGAGAEWATFVACLLAGWAMTVCSRRLQLPFAALAFASVVSMMPGFFVFKFASALIDIFHAQDQATAALIGTAIANFTAASLIVFLMGIGLILPKMIIEACTQRYTNIET